MCEKQRARWTEQRDGRWVATFSDTDLDGLLREARPARSERLCRRSFASKRHLAVGILTQSMRAVPDSISRGVAWQDGLRVTTLFPLPGN